MRKGTYQPHANRTKRETYPPRIFSKAKLAALMNERSISIDDLVKHTGLTHVTVGRIVQGIDLKLSTAFKLAKYFHTTVDELWEHGAR